MSTFKGSIPTPQYDTGDLVKVINNGWGPIEGVMIIWTAKFVPEVKYLVGTTWWKFEDIEGEYVKKESK